jgi:hypothetical protein
MYENRIKKSIKIIFKSRTKGRKSKTEVKGLVNMIKVHYTHMEIHSDHLA